MPNNTQKRIRGRNGNGNSNRTAKRSRKLNPYKAALTLRKNLDNIPIYAILCHSAICNSYAACGSTRTGKPFFNMPPATFFFNLTDGGELCTAPLGLYKKLDPVYVRNYVVADDLHESVRTYAYPLLSSANRAASWQEYPNFSCTFQEEEGVLDELGVYEIGFNRYIQIPLEKTRPWYLDEIILEVYKKTNNAQGIFVFSGCSSNYETNHPNSYAGTANAIAVIRKANLEYINSVPTMPIQGVNRGAIHSVSTPEPLVIVDMALTFGDPITLWSDDKEELEKARDMLITISRSAEHIRAAADHYKLTISEVMAHIAVALELRTIKDVFPTKYRSNLPEVFRISKMLREANKNAANSNAGANPP
jgi:hypothetical protein